MYIYSRHVWLRTGINADQICAALGQWVALPGRFSFQWCWWMLTLINEHWRRVQLCIHADWICCWVFVALPLSCMPLHHPALHSLGVTGLHAKALMKILSLQAIRSATKIIQTRRDFEHNPYKYLSNTPGGVQAFVSQPPGSHWRTSLIFILQVGCCVSLHPSFGGAEHKATSFPKSCRWCLPYLR